MIYYLAVALMPHLSVLNVFTYLTTRAGGAAFTSFLVSVLVGPAVIRWLRALKVGQYIRKDHVADLHELHKGKAGTPTMGGVLIILSTVVAVFLWARPANRLLFVAVAMFFLLGCVGFLDDYIKLRRKNNQGLSAKTKLSGQILLGILLGVYAVLYPVTPAKTRFTRAEIADWDRVPALLVDGLGARRPELRRYLEGVPVHASLDTAEKEAVVAALNGILEETDLYSMGSWPGEGTKWPAGSPSDELAQLISRRARGLAERERLRLNRLLLVESFPEVFSATIPNLHTKVEIPGLKEVFVPLGVGYALFVLVIIVASSNAVNLTDGLDGLAIGASIISLMAYTAIAYVVSRADWSAYLYLIHVPEASELTVFGAAMLGAGMGFLWFNSHPAEVFMGDTGSLALGGALGTMAVLTKQELLLVLVGGLFVLEGGSVVLQVVSFKLRKKRVFRMAPLHHHFELLGWSESKVTIRFWIIALLFALMSLAALKLR